MRPKTFALAALVAATPIHAQSDTTPPPILGRRDAVVGASFAAGALVAHTLDQRLATRLQRPDVQANAGLERTATVFRLAAQPGAIIAMPVLWGVGRLATEPVMADAGLHATESIAISAATVTVVKMLVGRARPSVGTDHPNDVGFLRGITRGEEYRSFPSGHTAAAFATAAALTSEFAYRNPGRGWTVGIPLYAAASMTGWSRMFDNRHWFSDVVTGAGVGTVTALAVTRYEHARPNSPANRWFLR